MLSRSAERMAAVTLNSVAIATSTTKTSIAWRAATYCVATPKHEATTGAGHNAAEHKHCQAGQPHTRSEHGQPGDQQAGTDPQGRAESGTTQCQLRHGTGNESREPG